MRRREFLKLSVAGVAGAMLRPQFTAAQAGGASSAYDVVEDYFLKILRGFLKNAAATSSDYAVCDFPQGTKLAGCCTPGGKTYVSVARMLPAMAEWACINPEPAVDVEGKRVNVFDVMLSIVRTAFDPKHPDFWGYAPAGKPTQRSVEACLVAWALWRMGRGFQEKLSSAERANINAWLASCTQVPERTNNHAWFTAINQAARLELSRTFNEFVGDEQWMLEDLKGLDALYRPDNDGWYSDSPDAPVYDYYNFYVFPNFSLYWGQIIGARYPQWNEKFRARVTEFLRKVPYFFDSEGGYPLYGRSLIYRWTLLSPMVSAYRQKLWPHSPGLLRRIVIKNLDWHWKLGAFDEKLGKLRETFSAEGSNAIRETYVDNGHPYWPMTAFFVLGVPQDDALWNGPEELLPVEKGDFVKRLEGPRMMLVGMKRTGEVKLALARPAARRDVYRDKYMKFVYSSHFPCDAGDPKGIPPVDQMLIFHNGDSGVARTSVDEGELLPDGVKSTWRAKFDEVSFKVTTHIRFIGEFELRTHAIEADQELDDHLIVVTEGSYALGIDPHQAALEHGGEYEIIKGQPASIVAAWRTSTGQQLRSGQPLGGDNLVAREDLGIVLTTTLKQRKTTVISLHYASKSGRAVEELEVQAKKILKEMEGK